MAQTLAEKVLLEEALRGKERKTERKGKRVVANVSRMFGGQQQVAATPVQCGANNNQTHLALEEELRLNGSSGRGRRVGLLAARLLEQRQLAKMRRELFLLRLLLLRGRLLRGGRRGRCCCCRGRGRHQLVLLLLLLAGRPTTRWIGKEPLIKAARVLLKVAMLLLLLLVDLKLLLLLLLLLGDELEKLDRRLEAAHAGRGGGTRNR